ncbi:hypothetical protein BGW41_005182 [Actinomortierella wolfii]|nr:hypothetical protein BGW41_005182 [Actinomortierella wolfii]
MHEGSELYMALCNNDLAISYPTAKGQNSKSRSVGGTTTRGSTTLLAARIESPFERVNRNYHAMIHSQQAAWKQ